jgi:rare lipoprotein A
VRLLPTVLALSVFFLSACGGHKQAKVSVPPAPAAAQPEAAPGSSETSTADATRNEDVGKGIPSLTGKALFTETGIASWYGPPYHNRRGSNGEVYDMNAMTAAHRTLPLGCIVRVTNLKTGHATTVRITDRGPFIPGRVLDLSLAAAKKVDVQQPGLARVRLDVLRSPVPLDSGGRWAVQIGAFEHEAIAGKLADHLSRRYRTAKVLHFASPTGDWWIRVRVQADERKRAEEVAKSTVTSEGAVFLVRLD